LTRWDEKYYVLTGIYRVHYNNANSLALSIKEILSLCHLYAAKSCHVIDCEALLTETEKLKAEMIPKSFLAER
jgi:hypothetical protein